MEPYNFWRDLFDTYQSLSDGLKALWLIVPPAFVLALSALSMRFAIERRRADRGLDGKLLYSIARDREGRLHIVNHDPHIVDHPPLPLLHPQSPIGRE